MSNRSLHVAPGSMIWILASGLICVPFLGWAPLVAAVLGIWGGEICLRYLLGPK